MLKQAFRYEAMNRTHTQEWYKRFKEGWTSIEDNKRPGQTLT